MLREIFFWGRASHDTLREALAQHIDETESCDTLFFLGGLDEVAEIVMERRFGDQHVERRLLIDLLNRPNVIITARPQATVPHGCQRPDMDLNKIGFNDAEVEKYIDAVVKDCKHSMAIKTYLRKISSCKVSPEFQSSLTHSNLHGRAIPKVSLPCPRRFPYTQPLHRSFGSRA